MKVSFYLCKNVTVIVRDRPNIDQAHAMPAKPDKPNPKNISHTQEKREIFQASEIDGTHIQSGEWSQSYEVWSWLYCIYAGGVIGFRSF